MGIGDDGKNCLGKVCLIPISYCAIFTWTIVDLVINVNVTIAEMMYRKFHCIKLVGTRTRDYRRVRHYLPRIELCILLLLTPVHVVTVELILVTQ